MHIQKLDDGSILLTAPVMIPGRPDCDFNRGEPPLTRQEVRDFKNSYERYKFVDSEHELVITGRKRGVKKDSYLLDKDTTLELYDGSVDTYPKCTWMLTSHITDPEAIVAAEKGLYTGYSPSIRSRETADKYLELIQKHDLEQAEALKSQSLSGLIKDVPNPVVLSVSLVRKPCQTGSKICKINGDVMSDSDTQIRSKVLSALGMSEAADVEALKSQVDTLEDKIDEIKTENAEALKSMKDEIIGAVTDSLKEFADKSKKDDEPPEDDEDDDSSGKNKKDEKPPKDDEDDEEEDEKKQEADKGSKQGHNHNNKSDKSQDEDLDTYEFLGRHPDGTRKQY